MGKHLDTWLTSVMGTLPEDMRTEQQLTLLESKQAGSERLLERNYFTPIVSMAKQMKLDLGDVGMFLWARGAADRNKAVAARNDQFPEGGSGLTTAQAREVLQKFREEGLLPKLNLLGAKVDALVDHVLQEKVRAGLLSEEDAAALREAEPHYVPLKGFAANGDMLTADDSEDVHSENNQLTASRAMREASPLGSVSEYRKAFGRASMPFHPLFNLFQDAEQAARRVQTNEALRPILRVWKQRPEMFDGIFTVYSENNPKFVAVGRDITGNRTKRLSMADLQQEYYKDKGRYMLVKLDGKPHYIEFASSKEGAALKRMFANMTPEAFAGAMGAMGGINNFLKGMLTYKNPLYLLFVAPLRDISDAIATAMHNQNVKGSPAFKKNLAGKTVFYAAAPSTWATVFQFVATGKPLNTPTGKLLEEMVREGGATLHTRFVGAKERADVANRAIKGLRGAEKLNPLVLPKRFLGAYNTVIDALADVMDVLARFATYRAATDLGITKTNAAELALDSSLNLTRRGEKAREMDLILPFFGANIEGTSKLRRIVTNPASAMKIAGGLITLGVIESLWNAMMAGDDDDDGEKDYLDLDLGAGLRMNRSIWYYGSGPDDYVKIPIGQMLGYFKFVGNKIGDIMVGATSAASASIAVTDATKELAWGLVSLISPARISGGDLSAALTAVTPLLGKPLMENAVNRNFFGSPVYQEYYPGGAPPSELGRATTADFWKALAKGVNEATGGSEAVKGGVSLQPEQYRHMIESWFGGPYQLAKQTAGLREAEGPADVPGIKSFVGSGSEYAAQTKYYELTERTRQIMDRARKLTPEQLAEQGRKYFDDTDPRVLQAFVQTEKALDKLNKEQKVALTGATEAERQMVLKYYQAKKREYYSAFNSVYVAAKRGQ
jgi:hypothetical protein